MKTVCIFDFDGTLFDSPVPNRSRLDRKLVGKLMDSPEKGGYGWFQDLITLSPDLLKGFSFKKPVVDEYWKWKSSGAVMILMSGRTVDYYEIISGLCAKEGLEFSEIVLKPHDGSTTGAFKEREISRIVSQYGCDTVHMWDDRSKHVERFRNYLSTIGLKDFSVTFVPDGDRAMFPPEIEDKIVNYLVGKNSPETLTKQEYWSVLLSQRSMDILKDKFKSWCESLGYGKWHVHHMTILHSRNFANPNSVQVKQFLKDNIGKSVKLAVDAVGYNEDCVALRVVTDVPSNNSTKHITLATTLTGKPVKSNQINQWKEIPEIELDGTIT